MQKMHMQVDKSVSQISLPVRRNTMHTYNLIQYNQSIRSSYRRRGPAGRQGGEAPVYGHWGPLGDSHPGQHTHLHTYAHGLLWRRKDHA